MDLRKSGHLSEAGLGESICRRQSDIDECALGLHNCSAAAICIDKKIGYECQCQEGLVLVLLLSDLEEEKIPDTRMEIHHNLDASVLPHFVVCATDMEIVSMTHFHPMLPVLVLTDTLDNSVKLLHRICHSSS